MRHYIDHAEPISDDGRQYFVYRHFDADGDLLYVGVTCRPEKRPYEHRRTGWWRHVVRTELTEPMSRPAAYREEWLALRDEQPAFNDRRRNGYWIVRREYMTAAQYTEWKRQSNIRCAAAIERAMAGAFATTEPAQTTS